MSTPKTTTWPIEPHTQAKHEILKRYLEAWFPILARFNNRLIYIDGFCGPGRYANGEEGSPIIAIKVVKEHRAKLTGEFDFWFIDERLDRIDNLRNEIMLINPPKNFIIHTEVGKFSEKIEIQLSELEKCKFNPIPTFVFIDPFGFGDIPHKVIERILKCLKCEVLITFMRDSINRWKKHPDPTVCRQIIDVFGRDVTKELEDDSEPGFLALRKVYQATLEKTARWVRFFEMKGEKNRVIYDLFFASNHSRGYVKMKEAMWKVDPSGTFCFSDATDPNQIIVFGDEPDYQPLIEALFKEFSGQGLVDIGNIKRFVEEDTIFLDKHKNAVLKHLEEDKRINVKPVKQDGTKRKKGYFPEGVMVEFKPISPKP